VDDSPAATEKRNASSSHAISLSGYQLVNSVGSSATQVTEANEGVKE